MEVQPQITREVLTGILYKVKLMTDTHKENIMEILDSNKRSQGNYQSPDDAWNRSSLVPTQRRLGCLIHIQITAPGNQRWDIGHCCSCYSQFVYGCLPILMGDMVHLEMPKTEDEMTQPYMYVFLLYIYIPIKAWFIITPYRLSKYLASLILKILNIITKNKCYLNIIYHYNNDLINQTLLLRRIDRCMLDKESIHAWVGCEQAAGETINKYLKWCAI